MTTPILKQLKLNVLSLAVLALTGCNGGELKDQTSNTASSQAATSSSQPAVLYEGNPFIPPEALTKAPKVEGQLRIADIPFTSPMFAECVFRTAIRDGLFYANEVKKLECGIESKNLFASFNGNVIISVAI